MTTRLQLTHQAARKGEKTKRQILAAALEVLALKGVDGTTHRAVAKMAGVSLSTTTYHFNSLDDMLVQAFELSVTEWNDQMHTALATYLSQLDASGLTPNSPPEVRAALRDDLAVLTAEYLHNPSPDRRLRLMAEMRFFFEAGHIVGLQEKLDSYRNELIKELQLLSERAGSVTPELDASILFDAVQSMQFRALSRPGEATRHFLLARARRYVGWILGC